MSRTVRLAVAQAAPVFLDREATVEKACALIAEAGARGAALVAFPESFVPCYPDWVWTIPAGRGALLRELHAELVANAVSIPGEATERLGRAAREAGVHVAIGVTERATEGSGATLYNSLLYLGADGSVLGRHRKLVPTGGERLVWAQGDGTTLRPHELPFGRVGGLVCWENYMPLARYALYAAGVQVYVAATWDHGEAWLATLRHIAREGRVVVMGCGMALHRDQVPDRLEFKRLYAPEKTWINPGDSAIVGPNGAFLAGPVREREEILYADVDLEALQGTRWDLDVAGHYARPDVFELTVRSAERPLLRTGSDISTELMVVEGMEKTEQ
ncbi:MAG TPA: carbon-nitrogen hydrolase family protein [Longimicrobiaceae bacterium]|nr:carbon-nitrogen hydrolase family protein [Longimicrobiaceae bacterium]